MLKNELLLCMGCMAPLEPGCTVCPHCGCRPESPSHAEHLKPATLLASGRYLVGRPVRHNPHSATYIGYDIEEDMRVLVVEFLPLHLATRNHTTQALKVAASKTTAYTTLLQDFISLHKALAEGTSEIVPQQLEAFPQHNTCYFVYRFTQTIALGEYISQAGGSLPWQQAKKLFMPLCTGLTQLHSKGLLHRGLCLETILVDAKGRLLLCDFALQELRTTGLGEGCELFEGYSAPEQYHPEQWQGSWTDVYSLAAVLYRCLTGTRPDAPPLRELQDSLLPANSLEPSLPSDVAQALTDAMVLTTEQRIQSVDELTGRLLESAAGNTAVFSAGKLPRTRGSRRGTATYIVVATLVTLLVLGLGLSYAYYNVVLPMLGISAEQPPESESQTDDSPQSTPLPSFVGTYIETVRNNSDYAQLYSFTIQEEYNDQYPAGVVFDQLPEKNSMVYKGVAVTLFVSKGSETVPLPNLEGSSLNFAMDTLTRMGIQFDIEEVEELGAQPNEVVRTDKPAGSDIRKYKDRVVLYVNKPQLEEPRYIIID